MNEKAKTEINRIKDTSAFDGVIAIIENARENAFRAVNRELINMYWNIGEYVSRRVSESGWGKSVVKDFSDFIQSRYAGIKGFSPQNIWRMKQFYETYRGNEKLSPLVREISWTNNILIMMAAKTDEEREFYLVLSAKHKYSKRELERQIDSALFERTMMSEITNKTIAERNKGLTALRDSYVLEFLDLPKSHKEKDLRKAIVSNLKDFILELGKDFTLVGEEYRVQVGNTDFNIDLLFYNRELRCLVAIELKLGRFKPAHLGQLEFYLEALDRDVKKADENPSVGLILCTKKDAAVVEYALSRSLSPAMIADYKLHLPDKHILENKLRELVELAESASDSDNE
jgi:predicted nuclease of restriction endonuclease-like (RecB) superfamily